VNLFLLFFNQSGLDSSPPQRLSQRPSWPGSAQGRQSFQARG
jgi:hypothetical protein